MVGAQFLALGEWRGDANWGFGAGVGPALNSLACVEIPRSLTALASFCLSLDLVNSIDELAEDFLYLSIPVDVFSRARRGAWRDDGADFLSKFGFCEDRAEVSRLRAFKRCLSRVVLVVRKASLKSRASFAFHTGGP